MKGNIMSDEIGKINNCLIIIDKLNEANAKLVFLSDGEADGGDEIGLIERMLHDTNPATINAGFELGKKFLANIERMIRSWESLNKLETLKDELNDRETLDGFESPILDMLPLLVLSKIFGTMSNDLDEPVKENGPIYDCEISALYGDDGKRQCGECAIDFKRLPIIEILKKLKTGEKGGSDE